VAKQCAGVAASGMGRPRRCRYAGCDAAGDPEGGRRCALDRCKQPHLPRACAALRESVPLGRQAAPKCAARHQDEQKQEGGCAATDQQHPALRDASGALRVEQCLIGCGQPILVSGGLERGLGGCLTRQQAGDVPRVYRVGLEWGRPLVGAIDQLQRGQARKAAHITGDQVRRGSVGGGVVCLGGWPGRGRRRGATQGHR
jgi:hypothetical protein